MEFTTLGEQIGAEKHDNFLLYAAAIDAPDPESFLTERRGGAPTPAEQTARAAYSSLGVSVREADMCEDLTVSISAYQHY